MNCENWYPRDSCRPDHLIRVEELTDENDDSGISISDVSVPIVDVVASAANTAPADPNKEDQVHVISISRLLCLLHQNRSNFGYAGLERWPMDSNAPLYAF